MEQSDEYLLISSLSEKQWSEIKKLGIQIYNSGQFDQNQMKCYVHAFLIWLSEQEIDLAFSSDDASKKAH